MTLSFASRRLADLGRRFYARDWVLGTSGNFSAVVSERPLRLVITPSGAHKGKIAPEGFVVVNDDGKVVGRKPGTPSAETSVHLEIVRTKRASVVLHTHSVWGTMLSDLNAGSNGLVLEGYEMLKGLSGVTTHEHREVVPVLENDQDMARLAGRVRDVLTDRPDAHAFLLRGHGLYTWGSSIDEAERHVEILEFLFEVAGRRLPHGHRHDS
jgi:methylthioribulose-1-phosphate dehydratase